MRISVKPKKILHYLLIYFLIISQGSILYKQYQDWFYVMTFVLFVIMYVIKTNGVLKDRNYFLWIGIIFLSMFISFVATGGSLGITSILNVISRFLFVYIIYDYDRYNFCNRYIKMIAFLSEISIVLFFIQVINPNIIMSIFPKYILENQIYYGTIFYTMALYHSTRNVGVFAEPGLYQIVLSCAIFAILFMDKELRIEDKKKKKYLIVFLVAVITAQSTTGYISVVILMAVFFVSRQPKEHQTIKRLLIVLVSLFLIWDFSKGMDGMIYSTVFEKIFDVQTGTLNLTQNTGSARFFSGIADLRIAEKYPLGAGFEIYNKVWKNYLPVLIDDTSSCMGITKSMATFGIPTTVIILLFYIYLMRKNGYNLTMKVAYILLFLNISLGQPSIIYAALLILLLIKTRSEIPMMNEKTIRYGKNKLNERKNQAFEIDGWM